MEAIEPYDVHLAPRRARDGSIERASLPGLARRLSAHRPPRLFLLLRGLHPHRRFHVQPACQMAEGLARTCRGGGRSPRSTISSPRMSGARTTTASAIRIPASSISSPTRRPTSSASISRRTPTRCCGSPIIACAPMTASMSSSPASSPRRNGSRCRRPITHCDAGIGIWTWAGTEDAQRRARCGHGLRRRRSDAGDARRGRPAAQGAAGLEDPRRQRGRPDDAAAERAASAWPVATATSTACSPATSR